MKTCKLTLIVPVRIFNGNVQVNRDFVAVQNSVLRVSTINSASNTCFPVYRPQKIYKMYSSLDVRSLHHMIFAACNTDKVCSSSA